MEPNTLCPVCLSLLRDPVLLKCGHNVCRECAQTVSSAELGAKEMTDVPSRNKPAPTADVICPMCGTVTPFADVVTNTPLAQFLEQVRPSLDVVHRPSGEKETAAAAATATAEKGEVCGFCQKPATKFCQICGALCEEHSAMLHVTGPFGEHVLSDTPVPVYATVSAAKAAEGETETVGIPSAEIAVPLCPEHKRALRLYCVQCGRVVCSHCVSYGQHLDHKVVYLSKQFGGGEERVQELRGKVEAALKEMEAVVPRFSAGSSGHEKEKSLAQLHEIYASLKDYLRATEQNTVDEVDAVFRQFDDEVRQRIISCHEIEREAHAVLESADRVAVASDLTKYLLYQSLLKLRKQLKHLSVFDVAPSQSVVKVTPEEGVEQKMRVCTLRSRLHTGDRALVFFELNKEHISDTFSVTSDVKFGYSCPNGGSVYVPERNLIVANSAEIHNGRSLIFVTFRNTASTSTELKHDLVAFRCGGMYPAFDGHDYVYFFQAGEGSNDKFGRLDLKTRAFETLAQLPAGSFLPHTGAAANPQHVYAMDNKMGIWDYCVDLDTWTDTHIRLEKPARLFFDPVDLDTVIALCSDDEGLYRVDIEAGTKEKLSTPPKAFNLKNNRDAFFARISAEQFYLFAFLGENWYLFDSKDNTWTMFENWEKPCANTASFFIEPQNRIAFYLGPTNKVLYMVELSGVAH